LSTPSVEPVETPRGTVLLIHGMSSSRRTWWRVAPDLSALGWDVVTVDLPGHGGRPIGSTRRLADLAADVAERHPSGATLVVGHSLGAIVALSLATRHPSYARGVLLEDPPSGGRSVGEPADHLTREVERARTDPDGAIASILSGHPTWRRRDARSILEGRLLTDPRLAELSPGALSWDLPALVSTCPVPVALAAARGAYSALGEPDRGELLRLLRSERVTELPSSHHLHLDEPARWVEAVDTFGGSLT